MIPFLHRFAMLVFRVNGLYIIASIDDHLRLKLSATKCPAGAVFHGPENLIRI